MNKLEIRRNENDQVVNCLSYDEDDINGITDCVKIDLPQEKLDILFYQLMHGKYKNSYSEYDDKISRDKVLFTFYDIDVDLTDKLRMDSLAYSKQSTLSKNTTSSNRNNNDIYARRVPQNNNSRSKPTVSRKNTFRNKAVMASVSLIALLSIYGIVIQQHIKYDSNKAPKEAPIQSVEIMPTPTSKAELVEPIATPSVEVTPESTVDISTINNKQDEAEVCNQTISLYADDCYDGEKAFMCRAYYYDTICTTAKRYGVDPNLALAVCTQERGIHSNVAEQDGGIGLFQIQIEGSWNWDGQTLTAYNFETQTNETLRVTKDDAADVFKNIQYGCMILQDALVQRNYNIAQAITYYNCGNYLDSAVLNECSKATGLTVKQIKNDPNNLEWLSYREYLKCGDPHYLENVFKYIENGTVMKFTKPNGEVVSVLYDNLNMTKNNGRTM